MRKAPKEKILVWGVDSPIGLTVLRELGRNGIEVHGVARSDRGVGLYSRWLHKGYILAGTGDQKLPALLRILKEENISAVMAISESDLLWLNSQRHAFPGINLLVPDSIRLTRVLDKRLVYEAAARVGVPTPRTFHPTAPDSIRSAEMRYPVVLKWADPNDIISRLNGAGIKLVKYEYAYSEDELVSILSRYVAVNEYPMVQEYCPGYGLGQMFLIHKGEVGLYFQHQRIHEWPPEGGFSAVCESVAPDLHAELREKSLALLRELGWEGVAMVEYRYDPESNRAALMEINGRFWGSQPLASHAGAEFAWQLYRLAVRGEASAPLYAYRPGVRCAFMIPELKRLAVILLASSRIQNKSLRFSRLQELITLIRLLLNPATRYFVFQWSDPRPCLVDLALAFRDKILRRG